MSKADKSFVKKKKNTEESSINLANIDTTFILNDINPSKLDRLHTMTEIQNIFKSVPTNNNTSKVSLDKKKDDLKNITTKLESIGFSDKTKEPIFTTVNGSFKFNIFSNFENKKEILSGNCNINCWYCRNLVPRDFMPLALPLKYYPSFTEYKFAHNSLINTIDKLNYKVSEVVNVNDKDKDKINYDKVNLSVKDRMSYSDSGSEKTLIINEYFDGEGIFCSFNCMLAFVKENNNVKYKNSYMLILTLYKVIFGNYPKEKILEAPSWKMLKEYGGELTINEYRKCFQLVSYKDMNQYIKALPSSPVNNLFLEIK